MPSHTLSYPPTNGEGPHSFILSALSVLLSPPIAAMVAGALLFLGLTRITLDDQFTPLEIAPPPAQTTFAIAPLFTPEIQRWAPQIQTWAASHSLDPNLVATVMQIESCGDPQALSPAGAIGLFQVMPYHFTSGEDAFEPAVNALRGLAYLSASLTAFDDDPALALAGYNGGINGASRPQAEWPDETRGYLYWGSGIYTDALSGSEESEVLQEWLGAGGASLCQRARASQQLAAQP